MVAINHKLNNKGKNSTAIKQIIEQLKDNYKYSGKIRKTVTHQKEKMLQRQKKRR